MATKTKTGQKAPFSGQYKPVDSNLEVTLVNGKNRSIDIQGCDYIRTR